MSTREYVLRVTVEDKDEYSAGAGPGHNPQPGRLPADAAEVIRCIADDLRDGTRSNWELPWMVRDIRDGEAAQAEVRRDDWAC